MRAFSGLKNCQSVVVVNDYYRQWSWRHSGRPASVAVHDLAAPRWRWMRRFISKQSPFSNSSWQQQSRIVAYYDTVQFESFSSASTPIEKQFLIPTTFALGLHINRSNNNSSSRSSRNIGRCGQLLRMVKWISVLVTIACWNIFHKQHVYDKNDGFHLCRMAWHRKLRILVHSLNVESVPIGDILRLTSKVKDIKARNSQERNAT